MKQDKSLEFKVAELDEEFDQIHRLNYQMFVEEIPQHPPNDERKLIDRFHAENTYVICVQERQVVAMIALRDRRPFSLDSKLKNLESYLPEFNSILEYRLLAVKKEFRNSRIFCGIMLEAFTLAIRNKYDLAVISGSVQQQHLYRNLGFIPFAHRVGSEGAWFQPMYIDVAAAGELKSRSRFLRRSRE